MAPHDVTVYAPAVASLLDPRLGISGGAERQMWFLAEELAARGYRVALVIYELPDPVEVHPGITLVPRGEHAGHGGLLQALRETGRVYRSLWSARSRVVVVRQGNPVVGMIALYCRLTRRKLVFSSASNLDFVQRPGLYRRRRQRLFHWGVRRASAVVVQSREQVDLARAAFPDVHGLTRIASFARDVDEHVEGARPEEFLWIGRLDTVKNPLAYVELARAVPEAQFTMIPSYFEDEHAEFRERVQEAAANLPNFSLAEPTQNAVLMRRLFSSVAIVNTSPSEGMPNTFLEGWARGVPALTLSFDPDGIIESHGLGVAAGGDWDAFVAGARELWDGRHDREELAARTRGYIAETHSMRAVGDRWEELLRGLGAAPSGRPARPYDG